MNTEPANFEQTAEQISQLAKFQDLFDSCAQLMAETLVNGGQLLCVGIGEAAFSAQLFADLLLHSPEQLRPPLPAIALLDERNSLLQLNAVASEKDFVILFNGPGESPSINPWLETCLDKELTSILINPDIDSVESTDKALEIRLEYSSYIDYTTNLSAVCNYLTKSIEKQLFGRRT